MTTLTIGAITVNDLRHSLSRHATLAPPARAMAEILGVVVHNTGPPSHRDFTSEELAAYHVNSNGWPCIAYSFVVHWDGAIDYTLDWPSVGYHAGGRNNYDYLGICLTGWFDEGRWPTEAQILASRALIANLGYSLGRHLVVKGHKDLMPTVCPGTTWPWWQGLLTATPREVALEVEVARLKTLLAQIRVLAGEA
jgi:N-acetylmuramoyl-L-alanine amidase